MWLSTQLKELEWKTLCSKREIRIIILKEIILGATITLIKAKAFRGAAIEYIKLPMAPTELADSAFNNYNNLRRVIFLRKLQLLKHFNSHTQSCTIFLTAGHHMEILQLQIMLEHLIQGLIWRYMWHLDIQLTNF